MLHQNFDKLGIGRSRAKTFLSLNFNAAAEISPAAKPHLKTDDEYLIDYSQKTDWTFVDYQQ